MKFFKQLRTQIGMAATLTAATIAATLGMNKSAIAQTVELDETGPTTEDVTTNLGTETEASFQYEIPDNTQPLEQAAFEPVSATSLLTPEKPVPIIKDPYAIELPDQVSVDNRLPQEGVVYGSATDLLPETQVASTATEPLDVRTPITNIERPGLEVDPHDTGETYTLQPTQQTVGLVVNGKDKGSISLPEQLTLGRAQDTNTTVRDNFSATTPFETNDQTFGDIPVFTWGNGGAPTSANRTVEVERTGPVINETAPDVAYQFYRDQVAQLHENITVYGYDEPAVVTRRLENIATENPVAALEIISNNNLISVDTAKSALNDMPFRDFQPMMQQEATTDNIQAAYTSVFTNPGTTLTEYIANLSEQLDTNAVTNYLIQAEATQAATNVLAEGRPGLLSNLLNDINAYHQQDVVQEVEGEDYTILSLDFLNNGR